MLPVQAISFMAGDGLYNRHGKHCVVVGVTRYASLRPGEPFTFTSHWPRESLAQDMLKAVRAWGWVLYTSIGGGSVWLQYERPRG